MLEVFMSDPIIDLHCDLLGCVEYNESKFNFETPDTNCSVPQLQQGRVKLQTLAVAVITRQNGTQIAERQVQLYQELLNQYPNEVRSVSEFELKSNKTHCIFGIENASALVEEDEPLDHAFERFQNFQKVEKILYVSLTWNHENRFGGGNDSHVGLKKDGEHFLDYLDGKNVAIDFSHTSDALAHDILNYIHQKNLHITPMASHSNFRKQKDVPRNLPDVIAKEIISLGGVIGINFVRRFVGDDPHDFLTHIDHAIGLGGEDSICLGADFYGGLDIDFFGDLGIPSISKKSSSTFYEEFGNSSCYSRFLSLLEKQCSRDQIKKIAYQNAQQFLIRQSLLLTSGQGRAESSTQK